MFDTMSILAFLSEFCSHRQNTMMPVDYLFRLDADSQIGTGHLMRCLAIADTP